MYSSAPKDRLFNVIVFCESRFRILETKIRKQ